MKKSTGDSDSAARTETIFGQSKTLIGMVHVGALPGTPGYEKSVDSIIETAVADAMALAEAGFDGLIVENMHDVPYLRRHVGPEIVAMMTSVAAAVREAVAVPIGLQILAGANAEAIAVAHSVGGSFIRAEGFVFASVADEGILDEADAGPLLRYRKSVGAELIAIFADIRKKHSSHAITADISLAELAQAAEFSGADGVILTGRHTAEPTAIADVQAVAEATTLPVIVGSGATTKSVGKLLKIADAVIVGSATKGDGHWSNPVDPTRAKTVVSAARDH